MDLSTVELLEFQVIRRECASYCLSREGSDLLETQDFLSDPAALDELLTMVYDFRRILEGDLHFPVQGFPEVSFHTLLQKEGRVLEGAQLAGLGTFIRLSGALKDFLLQDRPSLPPSGEGLRTLAGKLPDLQAVPKRIFRELDEEGNLREDHPALKKIRSRLRRIHTELDSLTGGIMRQHPSFWQMEGPVLREGRAVLPLKAGFRGKIQGIVHETSSSGQTVYVEPFELVELNNEKAIEESALRNITHAVLRDISADLREFFPDIQRCIHTTARLDTIYARGVYGQKNRCRRAMRCGRNIHLIEARHPLLGSSAVPIELSLSGDKGVMIITGPNAGGKTVTLKTLGLLGLMNQFGLEIPAAEGSELPVFDDMYADIGDDQSISASLSTFSGHMKRIAAILRYSTEKSLILLDELGAGTDPGEGSALAMALLDTFLDSGATVVVTTHHGTLKQFAYTRKGVVNASLEFDRTNLMPTYRVIPGIPGESHGLEIAAKSGITGEIIQKAEAYLEDHRSDVSAAIEELEKRKRRIMTVEQELQKEEERRRLFQEELQERSEELRRREVELKERELSETNRFVRESRKELENLVRSLREGEVTRKKTAAVKEFKEHLEIKLAEEEQDLRELASTGHRKGTYIPQPGDDVLLSGKKGRIIRQEKDGRYLVMVGSLKIPAGPEELKPAPGGSGKVTVSYSHFASVEETRYELDIRGMRLEEALLCLEKQLDGAVLAGLMQFNVIHGSGEGILRKGVHDYLRQSPVVGSFEFSHPSEGGFGKTIVRLKET
ncbi:MAG: endonuclease MutS2 [Spirochaetales bacterium]|nr:endonuclease MutS2 [Spirochaetales bacterium]